MGTICFIATQMQLINCVEYLNHINCYNNTLVISTSDKKREAQVFDILQNDCYSRFFSQIINLSLSNFRTWNFILSFVHTMYIWILAKQRNYNSILFGNYRLFYARLFESIKNLKKNLPCIVVDDGLATLTIFKDRKIEHKGGLISCFIPNRFIKAIVQLSPITLIPKSVTFYSVFQDKEIKDIFIKNEYSYLKNNANSISIPECFFNAEIVFLGQPLYTKQDCLTPQHYASYLEIFAFKNKCDKIIYYAHPEENIETWLKLGSLPSYKFVENKYPFEMIVAILRNGCRVISFFTSSLVNIALINSNVQIESIYLTSDNLLNQEIYNDIFQTYKSFEENGIIIHR